MLTPRSASAVDGSTPAPSATHSIGHGAAANQDGAATEGGPLGAALPAQIVGGCGSREAAAASEAGFDTPGLDLPAFTEVHDYAAQAAVAAIPLLPSEKGVRAVASSSPGPRDPNVDEDGHQVRERAVKCRLCGRKTWNYDARCDGCKRQRCYEQGPVIDSTCLLPLGHDEAHVWTDEVAR